MTSPDRGTDTPRPDDRSLGELLSDVSGDLSLLMRQELALAKAEAKQTATRAGTGAALLAGAVVAGYFVLLFLSVALWWSLGNSLGRGWSALVVTLVWAIVAAVLAVVGRSSLRTVTGVPRTTETVKDIPGALTPHPDSARTRR